MAEKYEAVTEDEWKTLATTEITHLTDEEQDYLPHAWDAWLTRVRRDAAREALDGLLGRATQRRARAMTASSRERHEDIHFAVQEYRDTHYPETEDQT